jgi:hypothetical protein
MKTGFFGHILEKYSDIKFHENPPGKAELFHTEGRTDKLDEANSRLSQFCGCA